MIYLISNKKAMLSQPIIVFLFLALIVSSLFVVSTSFTKVNIKVYDASFLDSIYVKEKTIIFYISEIGESVVENLDKEKDSEFLRINFNKNFKNEILKYEFEEDYLIDFKNKISEGNFTSSVENNKVLFNIVVELKTEKENLKIIYKPEIKKEFDLK
jgi:hypothetical protein